MVAEFPKSTVSADFYLSSLRQLRVTHFADVARRLPNAQLKIYPNSGHGGIFQHHQTFVRDALQFLAD